MSLGARRRPPPNQPAAARVQFHDERALGLPAAAPLAGVAVVVTTVTVVIVMVMMIIIMMMMIMMMINNFKIVLTSNFIDVKIIFL